MNTKEKDEIFEDKANNEYCDISENEASVSERQKEKKSNCDHFTNEEKHYEKVLVSIHIKKVDTNN